MISVWSELESYSIDPLSREELTEAIHAHHEHVPDDLRDGLANEPVEYLRMLLLTARLLHVLRSFRNTWCEVGDPVFVDIRNPNIEGERLP
jgi:hypothetical protein